jgi:hypothetical protein
MFIKSNRMYFIWIVFFDAILILVSMVGFSLRKTSEFPDYWLSTRRSR